MSLVTILQIVFCPVILFLRHHSCSCISPTDDQSVHKKTDTGDTSVLLENDLMVSEWTTVRMAVQPSRVSNYNTAAYLTDNEWDI